MSTEYILHEQTPKLMTLLEHSSQFDLVVCDGDAKDEADQYRELFADLTGKQLVSMAVLMLRAASYNMDDDEFIAEVVRHKQQYSLGISL